MKFISLTLAAFLTIGFAKAQSADEIVSKHIEAIGGKEKLAQMTSLYIESTTEVMGNESASKTTILNGKGFKNESDFNGQKIVQAVSDKGGWAINPFGGSSAPVSLPDEQYKAGEDQIFLPDALFDYAAHGAKVDLQGQEMVGNVNAYKLKFTNKDNGETTYYIDPASWYIIQAVKKGMAMGQEITVTSGFSNYKKTDFGVYWPYSLNLDMGQFALKVNVKSVEVNKAIDPSVFDMPKQ